MGSTTDESHDLILDRFQSLFHGFEQKKFPHEFLKNELTYYAKRSGFLIDKYRKQAWKIVVDPSTDDVLLSNRFFCESSSNIDGILSFLT